MSIREDVHALAQDGRNDGYVNSDDAFDEATDRLPEGAPSVVIDLEIGRAVANRRAAIRDGDDPTTVEFINYVDGHHHRPRPARDRQQLLDAYLNAWETGFRQRLLEAVEEREEDLREDLEDAVAAEQLKGRYS